MNRRPWTPAAVARNTWALAGTAVAALVVAGAVVAASGGGRTAPATADPAVDVATVERGTLSAVVSAAGILTYQARPDGSPYPVTNQASGTYTMLPAPGDAVGCGGVLYRVDERPVLLLCGTVPAYRRLGSGDAGRDVQQLNQNLHQLGCDRAAGVTIGPSEGTFTTRTEQALEQLQRATGQPVTGQLQPGDAIVLPSGVRISRVTGDLGGPARPGTPVAQATSDTLVVRVDLEPWQGEDVKPGAKAQITLPTNASVPGRVVRLGSVTKPPDTPNGGAAAATVPVFVGLGDPAAARGLEEAPVQVQIMTKGVDDALSVPVTALVGRSGGGFAVEVVRDGGRRELVPVGLGLFDAGGGRVQVEGDLRAGDHVVVPSV